MVSVKTKAVALCILIFFIGFAGGYITKTNVKAKETYNFQHKFERLDMLTQTLELSDVQKALLFNILADNKTAIDNIMKQVDPRIKIQLHILRENIKSILDEKQKNIYIKLLKEHEEKQIKGRTE
ncbi:MAG: hypothetical protein FWD54_01950 [Endomicrobia bacterium]|nr:hypothetical protein [Endomicrobiia bacterium]MCL2799032.1 hypothetical protein [Endomicrobiia bacterium]